MADHDVKTIGDLIRLIDAVIVEIDAHLKKLEEIGKSLKEDIG